MHKFACIQKVVVVNYEIASNHGIVFHLIQDRQKRDQRIKIYNELNLIKKHALNTLTCTCTDIVLGLNHDGRSF